MVATRARQGSDPRPGGIADEIDEALIEAFAQARRGEVSVATTNRGLAVLRRMLRLAHEWRIIDRLPRVHLLRGERNREFVLSRQQEQIFLAFAPRILHDTSLLMLDTALGPAEALALEWRDIHFEASAESPFGYLRVREGKTRYRSRIVSLTTRVNAMLASRKRDSRSQFVFAEKADTPLLPSSLAHLHSEVRRKLKLPKEFVLYSLRHTALTRLGEQGTDAFAIMRIAGHSSIVTSQRYVHPAAEAVGRAIARLESANQQAEVLAQRTDTRTDTAQLVQTVSD